MLPDAIAPASIEIDNGRIVDVERTSHLPDRADVVDCGDLVISPGIVDTHVHVNEPGRTDWEGFDTATRAAAAGGITTVVDMPLNSVPATTTVAALEAKRAAARGKCHVDVGFWGGVVPGNAHELDALVDAGVRGFKCFLVPSGVDELPCVGECDLRGALPILARRRVPLLVHAESPAQLIEAAVGDPSEYRTYLNTRPVAAEVAAIEQMIRLAREFETQIHIVHVACIEGAAAILRAQDERPPVRVSGETCPHYLTFAAEEIPADATEFKCAPPIRDADQRTGLWSALYKGLSMVVTDHSPAPPRMKRRGDFMRAWGGISSLEISLAAVWTGASARGRTPFDLAWWMTAVPSSLAGLIDSKGKIEADYDADLVVWDPDEEWTVDAEKLQQRHKLTPYAGRRLRGKVKTTFVRGVRVWDEGRIVSPPTGQLL